MVIFLAEFFGKETKKKDLKVIWIWEKIVFLMDFINGTWNWIRFLHDIEMGIVLLSGDNTWFYVAGGRQKLAFILIITVKLLYLRFSLSILIIMFEEDKYTFCIKQIY